MTNTPHATLYRMVLPDHVCPFGVRAKSMLLEQGYDIDDRILDSREAVEEVKKRYDVDTAPLIFIGEQRIGGSDDLARYLESI